MRWACCWNARVNAARRKGDLHLSQKCSARVPRRHVTYYYGGVQTSSHRIGLDELSLGEDEVLVGIDFIAGPEYCWSIRKFVFILAVP